MKKKLCVSFSGGETSGYMAQYLKNHKQNEYDMVFIFANTGQENEETLKFVDQCDKEFNLNLIWLEAKINQQYGKGTRWNVVNYETASRNGEPFEQAIKKLGLPNINNPWCTRDLKLTPIHQYIKHVLKWKDYWTAIGIRYDEIDRISINRIKNKLYYPLVQDMPMNKPKINFWWSQQKFRLQLKGYEGNCKWCWKKSDNKLMTIAIERPEYFDFPKKMEKLYQNYIPESKSKSMKKPVRIFRNNKNVQDIFKNSKMKFKKPTNDSDIYNWQISIFDDLDKSNGCEDSCEIY
tara:strand:+ start:3760 stop:4635 length:876 start_codon:yes stop_codon:yes gene_type:complete